MHATNVGDSSQFVKDDLQISFTFDLWHCYAKHILC